ncbi:MAG TPA: putative glycoside hydrolase [Atopostipes sp.]|nr:putative glycoside hydrolase [Atopostipes sp.]
MSRKIYLGATLSSALVLAAACSMGVSEEDVNESKNTIHSSFEEIINSNQQLLNLETEMDAQFATVLEEDEQLSSLQDGSAAVTQNIDERETIIEGIQEPIDTIKEHSQRMKEYEGSDLPQDTIQQISDDFLAFTEELETHQENQITSLSTQRDYLQTIAGDEANYEDFSNGIDTVNNDYLNLQEQTIELDQRFVEIQEQNDALDELTADFSEATEEATAEEDTENTETEGESEETSNEANTEDASSQEDSEETTKEAPEDPEPTTSILAINSNPLLSIPDQFPQKFVYDSGVEIEYPEEGVKGIYVTAHSAGGDKMNELIDLVNTTDLNAMVVDIKDDTGIITVDFDSDNELINEMTYEMVDVEQLMNQMEENDIYPIARIVVFKDTLLAREQPELSFTHNDGSVWSNGNGDSFVNPYLKEVWDYNIEVAIEAAKLGFKDIQFDYVRFPEGFETMDRELNYGHGHYGSDDVDVINMEYRNQAVTDFVAYAREQLQPYGVDVSVDIFGYAAVVRETPGIGQSFPGIAREVDVISSMIYPSHWGLGNLGVEIPDLEPYNLVNNYAEVELEILDELGEDAPITRPWIQDFTASYLGAGYYQNYGAEEVTAQVKALADNGIHEFLLWDAGNTYSEGATYSFE